MRQYLQVQKYPDAQCVYTPNLYTHNNFGHNNTGITTHINKKSQ